MDKNLLNNETERIFRDLSGIIYRLFQIDPACIDINTKVYEEGLYLNSLQLIELTIGIEEFYDFVFEYELLTGDNFKSISAIISTIQLKLTYPNPNVGESLQDRT